MDPSLSVDTLLPDLLARAPPWERTAVAARAKELAARGCTGLIPRLRAAVGREVNLSALRAELDFAARLSAHRGATVEFLAGTNEPDLRVKLEGATLLVEVRDMSPSSARSNVFHPGPRPPGGSVPAWWEAAERLRETVERLPVKISVALAGSLERPASTYGARAIQEVQCGIIAGWLADKLPSASPPCRLIYRGEGTDRIDAEFKVEPLRKLPGYVGGGHSLNAFCFDFADEFRGAIEKKRDQHERASRGPDHYMVALRVRSGFESQGYTLPNVVYGGLICDTHGPSPRSYRPVPKRAAGLYERSQTRGLSEVLMAAQYEPAENRESRGIFLDNGFEFVDAVLALYGDHEGFQSLPNPFASRDMTGISSALGFPNSLRPPARRGG